MQVTVTGVQHDVTQVCRCGETEVARGNWAWFGCDGQDNGEGFTVSVQYTPEDGPTTTTAVTVQPDLPLAALMATLARETHVPCARQVILHNGQKLRNPDLCIKELGIVEGTHLISYNEAKRCVILDSTDSPDGASQGETDSGEEAAILDMDRATLVTEVLAEIKNLFATGCAEMEDQKKWQDVQAILAEQISSNSDGYPEVPAEALHDIEAVFRQTEAAEVTDLLEEEDDISLFDFVCELSERLSRDLAS
ncbi:hypothetical protein Bbelb_336630 [Branchiostoma belcheri]|nr:hypothetical protein Bbelb_336630 [Branchiostoma belcheri]